MTWDKPQNESDILAGGMGRTAMQSSAARSRKPRATRSAFYGE
jgi:hypothetical protein